MSKETLITWATNAFVVALVACIPLGIFLAVYFNNSSWLMLCATLLIFLS